MAYTALLAALSMVTAASPALAANQAPDPPTSTPVADAEGRYCMRVEPVTGSRLETIQCWTREEWTEEGVDVDKEWAKEGVDPRALNG